MTPVSPEGSTRSTAAPVCTTIALPAQDLGDQSEASGSSAPAEPFGRLDNGHRGAEAGHGLPDLETDGATTDDEQRRRHRLGGDGVTVGPVRHVLEHRRDPGPWPVARTSARRARIACPPTSTDEGRPQRPAPGRGRSDRPWPRGAHGHCVVPGVRGLVPDATRHGTPIGSDDRVAGHARNPPALGQQVGRPDHHFRWDAPPIRALPAYQLGFDPDTSRPASARSPATCSPPGPRPTTTASASTESTARPSW